jgi:hypothetical protein
MKKIIPAILILFVFANFTAAAQFSYQMANYSTTNTPVFSGNNFKCIWIGKGNRIWAGTQYQGLYWFDTTRKAWTKSSQLTNVFINQIQNDGNGGIWIAQSGTSGLVGGGSNTAGGVNYFPDTTDAGMQFFSTGNTLSSRNVRGVYLDTVNAPQTGYRRIWVPQATFTTSGNTAAGGFTKWQDLTSGNFQKVYLGLQVFPNTNIVSGGTPSCYTACGNRDEVWIGAETNYTIATGSTSQILRYDALTGQHLGGWDQNGAFDNTRLYYNNQARVYTDSSTKGILPASFRTTAMYTDREDRRWIGLRSGGVVVKIGSTWKSVNMPTIFPPGTMINFNAITSDEFGYIYIGTSAGLVVFDNGGDVTDTTFYKRLTTADSLPSNNITGVAYDKPGGRMLITSDAGVTFMKYNYKIKVDMLWDYSFPERLNQPIGVAADGVSRIYLKIKKRSDTLPDIKEVNVLLKDYSVVDANTRGKLKKALVIDRYSEEASTGTANNVIISNADVRPGAPGEFWLWYVAPDDFSNDSSSEYASLSRRYEKLTIVATYLDNKKDTQEYKIGIVRPPTLFVHGLASDPSAWVNLSHNYFGNYVTFLTSPLFIYKRALTMDPIAVFQKNGAQLIGGDLNANIQSLDRLNTLQGNLRSMRNDLRYAANQVDYICHSMGGIMIRTAIGLYPNKFFAKAGDPYTYKTYGKGFTHKILTLNTPHNGAPIADVFDEFIPKAAGPMKVLLNDLYAYVPSPQLLGGLLKPVGNSGINLLADFKATDAVNNLQITNARGGVNMLKTPAKYHMLMSNVNWVKYSENLGAIDYYLSKLYKLLIQIEYAATYDPDSYDFATAEATRAYLRNILAQESEVAIASFLDYMSERRGYHNYMAYSDLVVPVQSQTAGQDENTSPQISKFLGNDSFKITIPIPLLIGANLFTAHTTVTIYGVNGNHSAVTSRKDVGQRVFQLLNTKLSSNVFADEMPADTAADIRYNLRPAPGAQNRPTANPPIQTFYDTAKIKIDAPLAGSTVLADSLIRVKFRVKDTTGLAYITIHFQSADSFKVNKLLAQQNIIFSVDPAFVSNNKIWATAVYENASKTGLNYYVDTISVIMNNLAPLQGFRIKEEVVEIRAGQPYYPVYEAAYNNTWIRLPNNDPNIGVSIDSVNRVQFDTATRSFVALAEGAAIANFTYKGFTDSVVLKAYMPYNFNCVNKTVAGGSFKNPAIWSKGVVPDVCDSVVINAGHSVTVDTAVTIRSLRISSGGTLIINNAQYILQLGQADEGFNMTDNYGTLNISNGGLYINGRIRHNTASTFTMSGGTLTIDANKGTREMSIADSIALFEAATGMTSFNFSGGTLQVNDPPFGAISQAINCPYDFGNSSILVLGISTSANTSKNPDGFGGLSFPNKIGKLIVNAGTRNGNRQFINKKPLNVKGSAEVKAGSGIILKAAINVTQ